MPSHSNTQDLLEKLRALPEDKFAEVVDFVDFLHDKQSRTGNTREERLRIAASAGIVIAPARGHARSSVSELPPVVVPGKPASVIVLEDRR